MTTSSSSTARTTWAEPGTSTTTRASPSTSRRPRYSYWFEPNPNWSRLFAPGAEIKQYADDVADKYDVRRHMRFNTTVEGARWDEEATVWRVALAGGETLTTRFLITATGFLSQPHTPDIPGIASFEGKVIHTTAWDDSYDSRDRRIAVIGTGATAVQVIPELAKKVAELTVYQRTADPCGAEVRRSRSRRRAKRLFARVPLTQRGDPVGHRHRSSSSSMVVCGAAYFSVPARVNIAAADLAKIHRFAVGPRQGAARAS